MTRFVHHTVTSWSCDLWRHQCMIHWPKSVWKRLTQSYIHKKRNEIWEYGWISLVCVLWSSLDSLSWSSLSTAGSRPLLNKGLPLVGGGRFAWRLVRESNLRAGFTAPTVLIIVLFCPLFVNTLVARYYASDLFEKRLTSLFKWCR